MDLDLILTVPCFCDQKTRRWDIGGIDIDILGGTVGNQRPFSQRHHRRRDRRYWFILMMCLLLLSTWSMVNVCYLHKF